MFWHPRNLTITQRLLALTALAMLPAAAVVVFHIVSLQQQREREVNSLAAQYAQLTSLEIERIISGAEGVLQSIMQAEPVRTLDPDRCANYLAAVHRELPQFLGFAVADPGGTVRCTSVASLNTFDISDRSYFNQAMETGRFVVGEYTIAKIGKLASLPLALPMTNGGREVTGVVITGLDLDWLGKRLRERNLLEGSSLTVADRNGVIIAREPYPERFVGTRIPDTFQHLVHSERPGSLDILSQDGTKRVLGYYPPAISGTGLYVSFGLAAEKVFAPIAASTRQSIVIALVGAAAVFAIAWLVGEQLFRRPIKRLLNTISAWRKGQDSARTGIEGDGSELAVLAGAIDQYMDELVADRAARRRAEEHRALLVRELDHRVKNILATVQAIATQSFRNEPSRAGLEAFAGRLAAMANTHEMLMSENWATAELRRTLQIAVKPFDDASGSRFTLCGPSLMIRARAALALSMAVHELCTNAAKYGALRMETGHVVVHWSIERRPEGEVFFFSWTEQDGPLVKSPKSSGFGTRMIQRALAAELSAKVDLRFEPSGLACSLECAVSSIVGEEALPSTEKAA